MKPKTLIMSGILAAICILTGALGSIMIVVFLSRDKFSDPIALHDLVRPIVLTNGLIAILFAVFTFALFHRLFKTSLFLLIVYFLLTVWSFLTAEYFDPYADSLKSIFILLLIFLLSLGVVGVYKEKHLQKINNVEQPVKGNR